MSLVPLWLPLLVVQATSVGDSVRPSRPARAELG